MRLRLWTVVALSFVVTLSAASAPIEVAWLGGKSITTWHGQAAMQAMSIAIAKPISPRTDVSFALVPLVLDQPKSWFGNQYGDGNEDVNGVAVSVLVRRTFHRASTRWNYYLEGGTGPMFSEKRVPASTSRFNFMTQLGAGFVLTPAARVPLLIGYRFDHISNGGYSPRNPGLNVSSLVLGLRFRTATKHQG